MHILLGIPIILWRSRKRFSHLHIYLLSPPDSKAPGQQSTGSYPPLWCLGDLPRTHGVTRICDSFTWLLPVLLLDCVSVSVFYFSPESLIPGFCLSLLHSIILAMRTMKTKIWLNWSILWILRAGFYARGTQMPIHLSQISRISEWVQRDSLMWQMEKAEVMKQISNISKIRT